MRTFLITGSGTATTRVAAATAITAALAGQRTLLASVGPTDYLSALFDGTLSSTPQPLAERLDGCAYDSLDALANAWEQNRANLGSSFAQLGSDELPTVPGMDVFFGLRQINEQAANYDLAVIDVGDYGAFLRTLAAPDSFRWLLRLGRTLVPTALIPFDWVGQTGAARVAAERLRDSATFAGGATLGFVLEPEAAALDAARFAIPALQLHGIAVAALVAGPVFPTDLADEQLARIAASQRAVIAEARATWPDQTMLELPFATQDRGIAALTTLGQHLYGDQMPTAVFASSGPIDLLPGPALALRLPGLPRGALRLTLSGDELIVRIGPYRRHIHLPESLRGITAIKASRDGDRVVIQRRT